MLAATKKDRPMFDILLGLELQDKSLELVAIMTGFERDLTDFKVETLYTVKEFKERYERCSIEWTNDILDIRVFSDINVLAVYMLKFSVGFHKLNGNL